MTTKPLVFVDLDDTLFQTARRLDAAGHSGERHVATFDLQGAPMSFMTQVQRQMVDWLLATTEVVPVTARSLEAFQRVKIPFSGAAVCSHGALIVDAQGQPDADWLAIMQQRLADYQTDLTRVQQALLALSLEDGLSLRSWVVEEDGLSTYVVAKNNDSDEAALAHFGRSLQQRLRLEGYSLHLNGNNLALMPHPLNKRAAVQELLRRDRAIHGERPVLGFGDSLSDLAFLGECHWWGTPAQGQVAQWVLEQLP